MPKNRPVPMTPPILQTETCEHKGGKRLVEGAAPDHGDMSVFKLTMEGPLWGAARHLDIGRGRVIDFLCRTSFVVVDGVV